MKLRQHAPDEMHAVVELFETVFAAAESEAEGALIGKLARDLFETTGAGDLFNYVAEESGRVIGSIFLSRLDLGGCRGAFILSPVAVRTDRQRRGVGRALIAHGLADLKARGVRTVLTYGDPAFYGKCGFHAVSPAAVRPPFELSQPEGWIGQSLVGEPVASLAGDCRCVAALSDPVYW